MTITLVRVDDRLIHGQTMTRWSIERPVDGILVFGDDIVKDELRRRVLKAAVRNLKLGIYGEDMAPEKVKLAKDSAKNFFIIANSPQVMAHIKKLGADFGTELNVGPMNTRSDAITVGRTLCIDDKDYEAFNYLSSNGVNISFQLIPDEEKRTWEDVKSKYETLSGKGD